MAIAAQKKGAKKQVKNTLYIVCTVYHICDDIRLISCIETCGSNDPMESNPPPKIDEYL